MELTKNKFYTLEEVAELFGITYQSVYRLVRTGELTSFKIGRSYRVADADLEAYMTRQREAMSLEVQAQTCARCGKTYFSASSLTGTCAVCGAPLCMTCVSVDKAEYCRAHDNNSDRTNDNQGE